MLVLEMVSFSLGNIFRPCICKRLLQPTAYLRHVCYMLYRLAAVMDILTYIYMLESTNLIKGHRRILISNLYSNYLYYIHVEIRRYIRETQHLKCTEV